MLKNTVLVYDKFWKKSIIWFNYFFYEHNYKYIWDDKRVRIQIGIYLVWIKRANTNTTIFGLTKKGKYKFKYKYLAWYSQILIWIQIFITHCFAMFSNVLSGPAKFRQVPPCSARLCEVPPGSANFHQVPFSELEILSSE